MIDSGVPIFPLSVYFSEDGETDQFRDLDEIACNLENLNSEDSEYAVVVTDRDGRQVILVVEDLEIIVCKLK